MSRLGKRLQWQMMAGCGVMLHFLIEIWMLLGREKSVLWMEWVASIVIGMSIIGKILLSVAITKNLLFWKGISYVFCALYVMIWIGTFMVAPLFLFSIISMIYFAFQVLILLLPLLFYFFHSAGVLGVLSRFSPKMTRCSNPRCGKEVLESELPENYEPYSDVIFQKLNVVRVNVEPSETFATIKNSISKFGVWLFDTFVDSNFGRSKSEINQTGFAKAFPGKSISYFLLETFLFYFSNFLDSIFPSDFFSRLYSYIPSWSYLRSVISSFSLTKHFIFSEGRLGRHACLSIGEGGTIVRRCKSCRTVLFRFCSTECAHLILASRQNNEVEKNQLAKKVEKTEVVLKTPAAVVKRLSISVPEHELHVLKSPVALGNESSNDRHDLHLKTPVSLTRRLSSATSPKFSCQSPGFGCGTPINPFSPGLAPIFEARSPWGLSTPLSRLGTQNVDINSFCCACLRKK